jgi:protease II
VKYYKLSWGGLRHSGDGRLFGWAADLRGADIFSILVRDVASGKLLVEDIVAGIRRRWRSPSVRRARRAHLVS